MQNVKVIVKGKARSRIALGVVTAYLRLHPNTTFGALKAVFPDSICPKAPVQVRSIVPLGVFQPLELVQLLPERGLHIAHYTLDSEILNTSDGVAIAVTKSWTQEAFEALTEAAAAHGVAVAAVEGKWPSGLYELDFLDAHYKTTAAASPKAAQAKLQGKPRRGRKVLLVPVALLLLVAASLLMKQGGGLLSRRHVDTLVFDMDGVAPLPPLCTAAATPTIADSTAAQPKATAATATPQPRKKAAAQQARAAAPKEKVKPQPAARKKAAATATAKPKKEEAVPAKRKAAAVAPAKPKESPAKRKAVESAPPAKRREPEAAPTPPAPPKEKKADSTLAKPKAAVDSVPAAKPKPQAAAAPPAPQKEAAEKPQERKLEQQPAAPTPPAKPKKRRYTQRPLI